MTGNGYGDISLLCSGPSVNEPRTLKDESSEQVTSCFGSLRHQSIPSTPTRSQQGAISIRRVAPAYRCGPSDHERFRPVWLPSSPVVMAGQPLAGSRMEKNWQKGTAYPVVPDVDDIAMCARDHVCLVPIEFDLRCWSCVRRTFCPSSVTGASRYVDERAERDKTSRTYNPKSKLARSVSGRARLSRNPSEGPKP